MMDFNKDKLRVISSAISDGYARDILNWFINPKLVNRPFSLRRLIRTWSTGIHISEADLYAGDMFRSLVLDENWTINDARDVYHATMDRLEEIYEELYPVQK